MFDALKSPAPIALCRHWRRQFRKVPGSSMAVLYCLDCPHEEQMMIDAAMQQILSRDVVPNCD